MIKDLPRSLVSSIKGILIVGILLLFNCVVTPIIIGVPKLELMCRPRLKQPFVSQEWKTATFESGIRYAMTDDLISSGTLVGKSKGELLELLGHANRNGNDIYDYELAPQKKYPASSWFFPKRFFNVESWILEIQFRSNVVVGCSIRES